MVRALLLKKKKKKDWRFALTTYKFNGKEPKRANGKGWGKGDWPLSNEEPKINKILNVSWKLKKKKKRQEPDKLPATRKSLWSF